VSRRQRGRAIDGWLVLDKPAGVTSTEAVTRARRALDARKAGHAGTLDPAATGLLAVAFGHATKTVPHVTDADKAYRFAVRWGASTDTDDAEGRVIATEGRRPDADEILAALPAFRGDIRQVPPQVSAVKVAGERAYDLARAGEILELVARPLHVARLDLVERPDADTAIFEMVCGKGGYVRSVARDLGMRLGCLGHVLTLRRLWSGPFRVEDAADWALVEAGDRAALEAALLPLEAGLAGLPALPCSPEAAARLRHGNPAPVLAAPGVGYGDEAWAALDGRAVAIGRYRAGELHPSRVFGSE
jgi:tRNA pseudouridine55 synthase